MTIANDVPALSEAARERETFKYVHTLIPFPFLLFVGLERIWRGGDMCLLTTSKGVPCAEILIPLAPDMTPSKSPRRHFTTRPPNRYHRPCSRRPPTPPSLPLLSLGYTE